MAPKIKVIDRGWEKIKRNVREFRGGGKAAAVGVQGQKASTAHGDELSNVALAAMHEFGGSGGRPPERSFIRATMIENKNKYLKRMNEIGAGIFKGGGTFEGQLLALGEEYRGDMIKYMQAGIPAKDSGEIAHLRQTGQLWNSIDVQLVNSDEKRAIQ